MAALLCDLVIYQRIGVVKDKKKYNLRVLDTTTTNDATMDLLLSNISRGTANLPIDSWLLVLQGKMKMPYQKSNQNYSIPKIFERISDKLVRKGLLTTHKVLAIHNIVLLGRLPIVHKHVKTFIREELTLALTNPAEDAEWIKSPINSRVYSLIGVLAVAGRLKENLHFEKGSVDKKTVSLLSSRADKRSKEFVKMLDPIPKPYNAPQEIETMQQQQPSLESSQPAKPAPDTAVSTVTVTQQIYPSARMSLALPNITSISETKKLEPVSQAQVYEVLQAVIRSLARAI